MIVMPKKVVDWNRTIGLPVNHSLIISSAKRIQIDQFKPTKIVRIFNLIVNNINCVISFYIQLIYFQLNVGQTLISNSGKYH